MAPEKSPAFQFYPKDFLADSHVMRMSMAERGVYITLLSTCWLEKSLPSDLEALARTVGLPAAVFRKLWPAVAVCFVAQDDGGLIHPRLEKERQKQATHKQRASDNGSKGAATRWQRHSEANGVAIAHASQTDDIPISNLRSPSVSEEKDLQKHTHARATRLFGREHREHASCGRACVPAFLHRQFVAALGGSEDEADQRLRAWYLEVERGFADDAPVPADVIKFWRVQFDAAFVAVKPATATLRAFANEEDAAAWVAKERAEGRWS